MKNSICATIGVVGAYIATFFGGWDYAFSTLFIFMIIDYITGLICAGIFHKSPKSKNGALESKAGFKGLCRKGMILILVAVGYRLDLIIGTSYIRDAVCIGFIVNELISITENAGLMGIPIPQVILNAIEILKNKNTEEKL